VKISCVRAQLENDDDHHYFDIKLWAIRGYTDESERAERVEH
jgi:hypothetical protein